MARVVWRNEALDHLDQITDYIKAFDPEAADRTAARLIDLGNSLEDFPRRGRPSAGGEREMTTVPPYVLTYMVDGGTVYILSIHHGRRRPSND